VRKGARLADAEVRDLFRLVIRRPDSDQIFEQVGRLLAARDRRSGVGRVLPRRAKFALARSVARRRLKKLFGRAIGGFGRGPFVIEGTALLFIQSDPGGDACNLLSGFCSEVIEQILGGAVRVSHTQCQSRGDTLCRWEAEMVEASPEEVVGSPGTETAT
jgi:hypothetical protein